MLFDKMSEECGVFGYHSATPDASIASLIFYGLFALQHRGQESCGIAVNRDRKLILSKKMGLVAHSFNAAELSGLNGRMGIGHVRYSTAGDSEIANAQPLCAEIGKSYTDFIALGHNGNLTNAAELKDELKNSGSTFHSTTDSEVILTLIARARENDLIGDLKSSLARLKGAFSLVILTSDCLIGVRDPYGVRPLVLGKQGQDWVLASETCALDIIKAEFVRELSPGEILIIDKNGLKSEFLPPVNVKKQCVFELIYFSRPDSYHFGTNVHIARERMGAALARQDNGLQADYVIAIPDSGVAASLGYGQESGITYERGFTRNHYIGRSFIHPFQDQREMVVKVKLNPVYPIVNKHDLVVIDDSLVRGTTCRQIVKILRDFGCGKVHLRFASPPIRHSCVYGIDTPHREKLLAANMDLEGIREFVGADSVKYLSLENLKSCLAQPDDFCYACFDGKYF
ncbi:MAG: amidophosphoribosyltransferase [Candidatus Wallbacteria bacterium]|nr:amidophosphoribosyltransferase [Candidatus Wallbacteria bacterium]